MKYISIIRGKFGRLSRREKRRFLLLFAVDIWIILLFLWVQQNHAGEEPAYVLAPGTPQRMILSLLLINCTVIALIAGGFYRRARCAEEASRTPIYRGDDLSMWVAGFLSDTAPKYGTAATPRDALDLMGLSYERGNIEQLRVVFENRTGAAIETDDAYTLEQKIGRQWHTVEELAGYAPHWDKLTIPPGVSEKLTLSAFGRYPTLERGYYRVVKPVTAGGRTVCLAGEFLLP